MYGCNKFHQYTYVRTVEVETDHKPLESIMTKKLYHSPLRLQKMLLILQRYDLKAADTLSRNYLPTHLPVSKKKYAELQKATAKDPIIQSLIDTILEG